ncbi:MAG: hypothetical protein V7644_2543 [Actinomycetota bacterium]
MGLPARAAGIRASDADRGVAVLALRAAWLEGSLTLTELEDRVATALRSRTSRELDELVADLPSPQPALPLLAGWWRRSAALALDHVLLASAAALVAGVGAVTGHAVGAAILAVAAAPLAALAYFTVAHGSRSGRSVGERICGIAVRSDPHRTQAVRRVTHGQAFGRAVMLYLFAATCAWGVGVLNFLWPVWDAKKQAWHDKVAGTIVVRAPALPLERRRWVRRWRGWSRGALVRLLRRSS